MIIIKAMLHHKPTYNIWSFFLIHKFKSFKHPLILKSNVFEWKKKIKNYLIIWKLNHTRSKLKFFQLKKRKENGNMKLFFIIIRVFGNIMALTIMFYMPIKIELCLLID